MQLTGKVTKIGKYWAVSCQALQIDTQGLSRKDGLAMMIDAIRVLLEKPDYHIETTLAGGEDFVMTFKDPKPVLALMVQRTRQAAGLTLADVTTALGAKSRNSVRTYETGKIDPSFTKLQELLAAMGYEVRLEIMQKAKAG